MYLRVSLLLLICVIVMGYAGYLFLNDFRKATYHEHVSQTARTVSQRIDHFLVQQRLLLESVARDPTVLKLFAQGTPATRARKEAELQSRMKDALTVHLLVRKTPNELMPSGRLDPACLEHARLALNAKKPSAPVFHQKGIASFHYDLLEPVQDEKRNTLGFVLVRFSPIPLQNLLDQSLPTNAYLALVPSSASPGEQQTLLASGKPPTGNTAFVTSSVAQGPWMIIYRPATSAAPILSGDRNYYFAVMLITLVLGTLALLHLYRHTLKGIRHDIGSLVRLFRDLREGNVRVEYPMALREFSEIFDYLRDRGQKLVEEKEKLKDMGLIDHLSQLANRRQFEARLKELYKSSRANGPSSVLIIDVDHFKAVNDKHGHDAGDALIVGFAQALRKVVRQSDVLARIGGDEFCIIYTYAPIDKAAVLAERLRKQLPREIPLTKGVVHTLRWTGGLSSMHDRDTKPDEVLWRADQALLHAKTAGRNLTLVYDPKSGQTDKQQIVVG